MSHHNMKNSDKLKLAVKLHTIRRKILTVENIDEFDEFSAIRQYFPYHYSYLALMNL